MDGYDPEELQEVIKEEIEELPQRIIDDYVAVLPVEIELGIAFKSRRGMSTRFGFTQEIKSQLHEAMNTSSFALRVRDCDFIANPAFTGNISAVKPSATDSELCNKTAQINLDFIKPLLEPAIKSAFTDRLSMAAINDYVPLTPVDYSFEMLCAGLQPRQPQFSIERLKASEPEAMAVVRVELDPSPKSLDSFCDDEWHGGNVDPRRLRFDQL